LGAPRYGLSGKHFGSRSPGCEIVRPDRVECYEKDGCQIEIWFRADRVMQMVGNVRPSVWDVEGWARDQRARPTPPAR
jgi:hypothetical protein